MSSSINSSHRLCKLNRYNKQLPVLHRRKLAQMEISLTYLRSLWVPQNTKTTRNNYSKETTTFKKILIVGSNLSPMILLTLLRSIRNNNSSKLIVIALRLLTTQSSNRSSSMRSLKPLGTLRIITKLIMLKVDPLSFQIIALI